MHTAEQVDDSVLVNGLSALEDHAGDPIVLNLVMWAGAERFDIVIRRLDPDGPSRECGLEMRDEKGRSHIEDDPVSCFSDWHYALAHAIVRASETKQGNVFIPEDTEQLAE